MQTKKKASAKASPFNSRSHYTTTRAILAKAAPWLALQGLVVLALTLSVGGLAL